MNIQKFLASLTFVLISLMGFSKGTDSERNSEISPNLKISYNSSLVYPGTRFGIEFPVMSFYTDTIQKSGKSKSLIKDRLITANLSWYHQSYFHDNLYFTLGWTMRRTKPTGFFTEFTPEIGVSRTFVGGTTYKVDDAGNVSVERYAGYFYALLSIGAGVGYDFSIRKSKPFMIFYKLNLISMYPYNSTIYMRPAMELGFIYRLSCHHFYKKRGE